MDAIMTKKTLPALPQAFPHLWRWVTEFGSVEIGYCREPRSFITERSDCKPLPVACHSAMRERGVVPTELTLRFQMAGLQVLNIWGGTAGNWGRRPVDLDEM